MHAPSLLDDQFFLGYLCSFLFKYFFKMAPFYSSMYILTFLVFCQIGLSFQDYDCEAKFEDAEKCFQVWIQT